MKKITLLLVCFCCLIGIGYGQSAKIDSLFQVLKTSQEDTAKVNTLNKLASELSNENPDSAIYFADEAHSLALKMNYTMGIATAHLVKGASLKNIGNLDLAMDNFNNALTLYEQLITLNSGQENKDYKSKILKLKCSALQYIGIIYSMQGNYEESLKKCFAALNIIEETGDKMSIPNIRNNIGLNYLYLGDYPEALESFNAALKIYEETGNEAGMAKIYLNMSAVYSNQDNYPKALESNYAALKIHEKIGNKYGIGQAYGNIAIIYWNEGNFPEALKNNAASVKIFEEIGDKRELAESYNNFGLIYDDKGDHDEALKNYFASLKLKQEIGDNHGIANSFNNIGSLYFEQSNYDEALKNYFTSMKMMQEMGDPRGIANSYGNIGNVYFKQKNYVEAYQFMIKALDLGKEISSLEIKEATYLNLVAIDSALGNYKMALEHYKLHIINRDSIFNQENTRKLVESKMQYEFDKKDLLEQHEQDEKDALALKELQRQKLIRDFALGTIGLVLILFFFIYRSYRARQALRLNDIRNRIAGDLHDDIGSTLNSISIYSEVARRKDKNYDEALEMIGDASRKIIEAMSDIVWTINAENDSFEKIIFRMKSLAYNLFRAKNIEFTFHSDESLNDKKLTLEERRNFYLIFKEAVNNMVKYAQATRAAITLTCENNRIRLRIQDNGVGFDTSQQNAGNGLKNMKRRADEMGAGFNIESQPGNGTQIELILKV